MKTFLRLVTLSMLLILAGCSGILFNNERLPSFANTVGTPEAVLSLSDQQTNKEIANQYRLIAVDKYLQANNQAKAEATLKQVTTDLTKTQQIIANMLAADIAVRHNEIATASQLLSSASFYQLDEQDIKLQVRIRQLKANVFEKEDKPLPALRELSYIASFLSGKTALNNQNEIWRLAMLVPLNELNTAADVGETGGWIELAKAVKGAPTLKDQQENIKQWLADNPNHPAAINPPQELIALSQLTTENYTKIAILLPQKEGYAQAIYNGFIAAYYQSNEQEKPTIKTYESTDFASIDDVYQQAQKDGVQLIIGPIDKKQVNDLSERTTLPITTLAINYSDGIIHPPQLFQIGLLPEDEAKEVAIRAYGDGKRHAVAIVPRGEWGNKVLTAFRTQWQQEGGEIDGIQYIDRAVDLDQQLVALTRKLPGKGIESTADDENMLFMVANAPIARQIKSLLTYRDAEQLPVYATSHIYAGIPNASQDNDLNGVLFTETPWLLMVNSPDANPIQKQIIEQWPQAKTSFARLYALGVDIWSLIPRLSELKNLPNARLEGLSGDISIDNNQKIFRKLPWATFTKGYITPVAKENL